MCIICGLYICIYNECVFVIRPVGGILVKIKAMKAMKAMKAEQPAFDRKAEWRKTHVKKAAEKQQKNIAARARKATLQGREYNTRLSLPLID